MMCCIYGILLISRLKGIIHLMKAALTNITPPYPQSWQALPQGEAMRELIESSLREPSRKFFGYHLLRVGNLSAAIELPECPIKHRVNVSPKAGDGCSIMARSDRLPLAENSVDAVLLIHELDFARDPHQVLREACHCIIPNGHLIVAGFNPWSLCGLFKYLPFNRHNPLHKARFFSLPRSKDWLQLLGFEIVSVKCKVFSDVFLGRRFAPDSRWSKWCEKYLAWFAGVYIIEARKREIPLSLIKPKWHTKPKFAPVAASWKTGAMSADSSVKSNA